MRKFTCKLFMHNGKCCWANWSMELAVIGDPSTYPSPSEYTDSALPKFFER